MDDPKKKPVNQIRKMHQNVAERKNPSQAARGHHGLAVVATTVSPWWQPRPWWSWFTPVVSFSFVPFGFPARFSDLTYEFAFEEDVLGCKNGSNSTLPSSHPPFYYHLVLVFIRLERKRERRRLQGFHAGFAIERLKRDFG